MRVSDSTSSFSEPYESKPLLRLQRKNSLEDAPPSTSAMAIWWRSMKRWPKEVWLIFLLKYLESYAYFVFAYTLILFLSDEFGFSDEEAGWSYGFYGMLVSVYGFIMGSVIDTLGPRWSLTGGMSILLVSRLIMATTYSTHVLAAVLFTSLPIGGALGIPVMQIAIKRFTEGEDRSTAFSMFYVIMNIAAITAAPCIDAFHRSFPRGVALALAGGDIHITVSSYRILFLTGAFVTALCLIICLIFLRDPPAEPTDQPQKAPGQLFQEVMASEGFWRFLLLVVLLMGVRVIYRHMDATFPKYMVREFGPDALYGTIIALNPLCVVFLVPLLSPLALKYHPLKLIIVGATVTAISPYFLVMGHTYITCICFVLCLSIGESIWSPRLYEYTVTVAEDGREGTYMALASTPMFVATLFTGAVSGWLLDTLCPANGIRHAEFMWLLIAVGSSVSPVLLFVFRDAIAGCKLSELEWPVKEATDGSSNDEPERTTVGPSSSCVT
ncbi:hypothetical protein FOL47_007654 [Perkinsus chesapeaki]|uniref:Major facilitator superfamily (MFS) profile domain-containing protein n=1 Tax=Perkinsus chesapeaki TaxID=330153 RepID=A0A7J6MVQ1_PERCH|nr:hypothetical protein FOL47_007654 [Perkinsus chesapeaki]